jgi:hypothetical protein
MTGDFRGEVESLLVRGPRRQLEILRPWVKRSLEPDPPPEIQFVNARPKSKLRAVPRTRSISATYRHKQQ